ncbi:MAG: hypothetical protein KatS3mg025_1703 [Bacteroidia bacterium]|nr:MAG: hypothetical protein KatS3mg025_1703 [Bacteroidia bacterium]
MWLLLRREASPDGIVAFLQQRGIAVQTQRVGERWAIFLPANGAVTEACLRWEEVERVISGEEAYPLVRAWTGEVQIGTWRRGEALLWIAGPCSVEERRSLLAVAQALRDLGVQVLRGGAYKARTSPYTFQGLGEQALDWLAEAKALTGLPVCVEILTEQHVALYLERGIDVFQIGARNMDNYWLLREVGQAKRPVLLKRNPQATIQEWLLAAEYLLLHGASVVWLCERGIRTFERSLRYTLDVGALPVVAQETALPRLVDPSHAAGRWMYVEPLALAGVAAGAEGLLIEVHPNPPAARSDAAQQLTVEQFARLKERAEGLFAGLRGLRQPLQSQP